MHWLSICVKSSITRLHKWLRVVQLRFNVQKYSLLLRFKLMNRRCLKISKSFIKLLFCFFMFATRSKLIVHCSLECMLLQRCLRIGKSGCGSLVERVSLKRSKQRWHIIVGYILGGIVLLHDGVKLLALGNIAIDNFDWRVLIQVLVFIRG